MAVIVSFASHVVRGHVGNSVTAFALERLGFEVWPIMTVQLPYHPGHAKGTRIETPAVALGGLVNDLIENVDLGSVAAVISGYIGVPAQAIAVARFVDAVKAANLRALYCCDPVIGDEGRLYVDPLVATEIRDLLIPRADMATPNVFELAWLTRGDPDARALAESTAMARRLGPPEVYVTSAEALMRGQAATLAVTPQSAVLAEAQAVLDPPHGLGDLMAALLLAHRLRGRPLEERLRRSVASVHDLAMQTERQGRDEMPLTGEQVRLLQSSVVVQIRHMAGA